MEANWIQDLDARCREKLPLNNAIVTEGRPEEWLNDVESAMFSACKSVLYGVLESSKATKKEKWVKENQGQCIITAGQILWTMDCEKALSDPDTAKRAMRQLKKKWVSYLTKLTSITRSKLSKIERNKTVALITIEVHARDVIDKLGRAGCTAATDFEWVSQLRFYWDRDADDCVVRQVLSVFKYGYEYQVRFSTTQVKPNAAPVAPIARSFVRRWLLALLTPQLQDAIFSL